MKDPLTLYKFRSLNNFEFVADIILNRRFYTAQFFDLNDPMEGLFSYTSEQKEEYLQNIVWEKGKLRICSFSKEPDNLLMWAHYADGFKGVCVEAEVASRSADYELANLRYCENHPNLFEHADMHAGDFARKVLSRKNIAWKYEREERALSQKLYISDGIRITRVLLGQRTPDTLQRSILKLTEGTVIEVWNTEIDSQQNKIIKADKLN